MNQQEGEKPKFQIDWILINEQFEKWVEEGGVSGIYENRDIVWLVAGKLKEIISAHAITAILSPQAVLDTLSARCPASSGLTEREAMELLRPYLFTPPINPEDGLPHEQIVRITPYDFFTLLMRHSRASEWVKFDRADSKTFPDESIDYLVVLNDGERSIALLLIHGTASS